MNEQNKSVYEYECDECQHHFEVEMTFRERPPFDRDEKGRERPAGYPEQHPECPTCHSHDVVRVNVREVDRQPRPSPTQESQRGSTHTMSTIPSPTVETTVGDLVAQRPSRSRVFEKLGIDYCCGGKQPLSEACAAKGLDAGTVLTTLLAAEEGSTVQEPTWADASLTDLADHIEQTHHAYLKRELPRLRAIVRKVAAVHGEHHPWLREFDGIYNHLADEMESHMMKEEQVLFPMIRGLERGESTPAAACGHGVGNPIRAMEHEHDETAQNLAGLRKLSDDFTPPSDACNTFRAMLDGLRELESDLHRHIHKENNILFPEAIALDQKRTGSEAK